MTRADRLITELTEKVGLEPVDAHRAAFTALAVSSGWTKARVGRYLGITRARVGQKVDKLLFYAAPDSEYPALPELRKLAHLMVTTKATLRDTDKLVAYDQADWCDLDFARQLVDMVA